MNFERGVEFAKALDRNDPLKHFRERFAIPKGPDGREVLYLAGNSLGLAPKKAKEFVEQEFRDWERLGVEGHFHGKIPWVSYHEVLTEPMARIVGAKPSEVVTMNGLTVNLHLMMLSFYRPTKARHKILVEKGAFPSDRYAVASQIRFHGFDPASSFVEAGPGQEEILAAIGKEGDSVALVLLAGVHYYTGQCYDLEALTQAGRKKECVVGFDLAHSAGNVILKLHEWGPDFAVWCSYKYLNGGPGGPAGCFVHERHATETLPRLTGWWGHDKEKRFLMGPEYVPIPGAQGWQLSNPPIFSMAAVRASLEIFDEVGMEALRAKSVSLTGYLEFLLSDLREKGLTIVTPSNPMERGAQLSLRVARRGKEVFAALTSRGVMCDWREPDAIRVAPVPLYNTHAEVFEFAEILRRCL